MAIFFFLVLVVRITIVQSKRQTRNENFRTDLILVCISVVMVNDDISSASSGGGGIPHLPQAHTYLCDDIESC